MFVMATILGPVCWTLLKFWALLMVMEMKRRFPKEREKMRIETDATAPQNSLLLVMEGIQSLI